MKTRNDSHFRQRTGNRVLLGVLLLVLGACSDAGPDSEFLIVASTPVLGEMASAIAGDMARVEVLMPADADPHDYEPSAQQAALAASADLIIVFGLGLESGMADLLDGARADGVEVLDLAIRLDPIPLATGDGLDPHIWFDPLRMVVAAGNIAEKLEELAPGGGWAARSAPYIEDLRAADARILELIDAIPRESRRVVTNHDSFGYFADRYGFEIAGVVTPGGTTLAEPGSAYLARLLETIDREEITVILADTTEPYDVAEALAGDADHPVAVVVLHGSLGAAPADTLAGMLEENARLIAEALWTG